MAEIGTNPIDGDTNFSGGWSMAETLQPGQYRYMKNGIIASGGKPMTRPGMRRAFRVLQSGFRKAFWFGDQMAGTGFWFPFTFVASAWGKIQGTAFFRFLSDANTRQIVVSDGRVFVHNVGFVDEIDTDQTIDPTELIQFVQANQYLFMLRGEDKDPLYWDGGSGGFISVPAGSTNSIPRSGTGAYVGGRLWLTRDRDDLYASDVLDPTNWNYVNQMFSISRGDGDEIVRVFPFHDDYCIVFKKRKIMYLGGTNAVIQPGTTLDNYVSVGMASDSVGLVAPLAVAAAGEQIFFLSYEGVMNLSRVQQGKLMGSRTPVSHEIQPMIDRINWGSVGCACAIYYKNRVIFAVPIDGSTVNNIGLVYNLTLNGGQGAWEGTIESRLFTPVSFYVMDEKLYFLSTDGSMRVMWSNDPWDSEDVFDDTPIYEVDRFNKVGDYVYTVEAGENRIYECVLENLGQPVSDATYWSRVLDPQNLYRVEFDLTTRHYFHGEAGQLVPKRWGTSIIKFKHQNPSISLYLDPEDYETEKVHIEDVQFSQVKYDIANTPDWDPTNVNLDFRNPHRQDYSVFLSDRVHGYIPNGDFHDGLTGWVSNGAGSGVVATAPDGTVGVRITGTYSGVGKGWGSYGRYIAIPVLPGMVSQSLHLRFIPDVVGQHTIQVLILDNTPRYGNTIHESVVVVNSVDTITWHDIYLNVGVPTTAWVYLYFAVVGIVEYSNGCLFSAVDLVSEPSLWMDHRGIDLGVWEHHAIRFIPLVLNNTGLSLRVNCGMGAMLLDSTVLRASGMKSYMKER